MKKLKLLAIVMFISITAFSQTKKRDSLIVQMTMDTTTFKNVINLIKENINGNSTTGQMILGNILNPIYQNFRLVPAVYDVKDEVEAKKEKKAEVKKVK